MDVMAADSEKRRALVVEDERPIRELVRLHLELGGFAVDEAGDGTRALALVRATAFDLLILDVMLPGLDGVTLCTAVARRRPEPADADPHAHRARRRVGQGGGA